MQKLVVAAAAVVGSSALTKWLEDAGFSPKGKFSILVGSKPAS